MAWVWFFLGFAVGVISGWIFMYIACRDWEQKG